MFSRKSLHVIKIVVLTSLVWCMLDVWILTYYSDCSDSTPPRRSQQQYDSGENENEIEDSNQEYEVSTPKSLLNKFIDKVPEGRQACL